MSFGGDFMASVNEATANLVASGVTVVAASGNDNVDAIVNSPASVPTVITVSASNITDAKSDSSNWGSIIDIWAPGTQKPSTVPKIISPRA